MKNSSPASADDSRRSPLCESVAEERANAVSHGIGAVLSVAALVVMVCLAARLTAWHVTGVSIFGGSLALLYLASTIYHSVTSHRSKRVLQVLDHALIYVLIAGSYTPWLLVNLRGPWGWSLFGVIWGLAVSGIVLKAIFLPRFDKLGAILYVAMGWLICIALKPMVDSISFAGLAWLVAGGVCYTAGVGFYLARGLRFAHVIWHGFVLAGSACHVVAVFVGILLR